MAKTHEVLTSPAPHILVKPRAYTPEQDLQIKALRKYADDLILPESDPYYVWEKRWLDKPDTMPRYMRAAKWRPEEAKKRLQGTLAWRREFKPDLIPPEEVRIESETGKIVLNGFDNDGRPILYMRPGLENTQTSPRQLRHLVWCLERAKDFMPEGQDTVVIIVDYKSTTLRTNPSISVARKVLTILQQHYVETLGRAIVVNLPGLLSFFYKGISPFLDPVTRDKMRFNPDLLELVPAEQLDAQFGGTFEYEFEPVSYWEQIVAHCRIAPDGTRLTQAESAEDAVETEKASAPSESSEDPTDPPALNGEQTTAQETDGTVAALQNDHGAPKSANSETHSIPDASPFSGAQQSEDTPADGLENVTLRDEETTTLESIKAE